MGVRFYLLNSYDFLCDIKRYVQEFLESLECWVMTKTMAPRAGLEPATK